MRLLALKRLKITPDVYYDLTPAETRAMLEGEADRELLQMRLTRMVATLIRNAHFEGNVSESEYWALPGDVSAKHKQIAEADPTAAFYMLAQAMGGTITVEPATA